MRHHNRARLIDIADNKLNPKEKLVVGKNGHLVSPRKPSEVSDLKNETTKIETKLKVETVPQAVVAEEEQPAATVIEKVEQVVTEQEIVVEKKTKKKPFGKTQTS